MERSDKNKKLKELKTVKDTEDPVMEELENLKREQGLETVALGSRDGLLMKVAGSPVEDLDECIAMAATMLGAAEKIAEKTKKGTALWVNVELDHGAAIVVGAGPKGFLLLIARPIFDLVELYPTVEESAADIRQLLG